MAKEVSLTVKVDDDQFQAFVKNFNDFSDKLKELTERFKSVGTSTDASTKAAQQTISHMRNLLDVSKNIHSTIGKITGEFGKWSTLIGGTIMMLGGGAGMFGIDRLLNQFIQKQRTALGMGMTQPQGQAITGMEGLVPGSPEAILRNIQMAKTGDLNKIYGANALGLDLSKKPEEIYKDLLRKLPGFVKGLPKGFELKGARDLHVTDITGDEKILEAKDKPEELRKELQEIEYRERHLPKLSDEQIEKLRQLKNSWNDFTATVGTRLTQGVAAIAPFLTRMSKGADRNPRQDIGGYTFDADRSIRHAQKQRSRDCYW